MATKSKTTKPDLKYRTKEIEELYRLEVYRLVYFLYDNPKIAKSLYDKMLPDITKWEEEWIDDPRYTV